jgi:DNA helicase HerA-like ATPase
MGEIVGHVTAVGGSQATVAFEPDKIDRGAVRIGAMVKIESFGREVLGTISTLQVTSGPHPSNLLVIDLLGELAISGEGRQQFSRGVSHYPVLGAAVRAAGEAEVTAVYRRLWDASLRIGTLDVDATRPAFLLMDELLNKHFAVLGATGSGKSCAVTLILSTILIDHPNAHIVLLDAHNEYTTAFGDLAEVINIDNLQLPFWLLDFEEAARVLIRGGTTQEQEAQAIILKDAITRARRHFAGDERAAVSVTVDTPVPFRVYDLLRIISEEMGRLDKPDTSAPYLRLMTQLESLRSDPRFAFMFTDWFSTRDTLPQIVGRLLRIPGEGKPLTVLDLSGLPSEVSDVVVSLICRIMFDFALWTRSERMPPILLVCEEAHRYVPADPQLGFAATTRVLTRIAKEGRKYGLSLALVSQRPSALAVEALSQCGTLFALRMGNEADQRLVATAFPDTARGMLAALPSLKTREAIVLGEGVPLPMRIHFDELPENRRPHSPGAPFSKAWRAPSPPDTEFLSEGVRHWRSQRRTRTS